ncbi:hypothetical protein F5Y18DRAFT_431825 [Xylariaceae sp. FL1019]|nr:hypothetical protein F5Y18DRAFT_431825 [Xylariaceae sp. FL1019]
MLQIQKRQHRHLQVSTGSTGTDKVSPPLRFCDSGTSDVFPDGNPCPSLTLSLNPILDSILDKPTFSGGLGSSPIPVAHPFTTFCFCAYACICIFRPGSSSALSLNLQSFCLRQQLSLLVVIVVVVVVVVVLTCNTRTYPSPYSSPLASLAPFTRYPPPPSTFNFTAVACPNLD